MYCGVLFGISSWCFCDISILLYFTEECMTQGYPGWVIILVNMNDLMAFYLDMTNIGSKQ